MVRVIYIGTYDHKRNTIKHITHIHPSNTSWLIYCVNIYSATGWTGG